MDLFVAIWRPVMDTYLSDGPMINTLKLRAAATTAYAYLRAASARIGSLAPQYIFVAPEYLFIKDANFTLFTRDERDNLFRDLARVSGACPTMLMFPGTVNWEMDITPMANLIPHNTRNRTLGGWNTAPVFFGGARIHTYDKRMNDGNVDRSTNAVFIPGTNTPLFHHGGVNYGIEVCGDYAEGRLAAAAQTPLDVEVMMSATIGHTFSGGNIDKIPVRQGGAFIHCDGSGLATKNGLWVVQTGSGWHGSSEQFSPTPGWRQDPSASRRATTAPGNMNKIGKLLPESAYDALDCYTVSI
jgi:hypothetical protein